MEQTIEQKILEEAIHYECSSRKDFNDHIEELLGKEAKQKSTQLWNEGLLMLNGYGYVNPSRRGYNLWQKGIRTPKRKPKQHPTTAQYLDYLWRTSQCDFEKWLQEKGFQFPPIEKETKK